MTIIEQFRECFQEYSVGTQFTRQQIIDMLNKKYGTNPSSIVPSDHCYNMTNKGRRGAARDNNFFLNIEDGQYEYVGEHYTGFEIKDIIAAYKSDFQRIQEEENYKWEAIGWYKIHWDINASDFSTMLSIAFSKAANLLSANMYYPYRMLCNYAEEEPETVRKLFINLYEESIPLATRYANFRSGFAKYIQKLGAQNTGRTKPLNHYQDLHAVSVYLSFEYSETYYIFKYGIYKEFKNLIGFVEDRGKAKSEVWRIENYNRMCSQVLNMVQQDIELQEMSKARLDENCYSDDAYHLLAMDIVYFGSKMKTEQFLKEEPETDYWPTLEEYNPEIDKEKWIMILKDGDITSSDNLAMLKMILDQGGESTCAHLAEVYGNVHNYYNKLGSSFGEKIKKKYKCPDCLEEGVQRFYPIPFLGRVVMEDGRKRYSWKLRCELEEALRNIDLSEIELRRESDDLTDVFPNTILYGPPGTGKTYSTIIYAVAVIEKKSVDKISEEEYDEVFERFQDYKAEGFVENITFHQAYGYEEFIEGIKPIMNQSDRGVNEIQYHISSGLFKTFCDRASESNKKESSKKNYVFIIDEINRGNISKIFGELITLIEPSKRIGQAEGTTVKLPYSKESFGVPDNVYLIATMNTADRSIATIDTALRRRFRFKEMQPNTYTLGGISVEDLSIKDMLERMNKRITVLYDREHTIGHAYFMPLKNQPTIEELANIFSNSIIPLLQEYFYEDYEKIRLVLGDNNKQDQKKQFIIKKNNIYGELFGNTKYDFDESSTYEVNNDSFENIESYRSI